jgi:hypothetical protein
MYNVYWMKDLVPQNRVFESHQLKEVLEFTESLRKKQREGERYKFITFVSENPDQVGESGVAEVGPDYNWKKRR